MIIYGFFCFVFSFVFMSLFSRRGVNIVGFSLITGFVLQYFYAFSYFFLGGKGGVFEYAADYYLVSSLIAFLYFFAFYIASGARDLVVKNISFGKIDSVLMAVLFIFSLIGSFLLYTSGSVSNFGDRLEERAGAGYLFLFGYAGLILAFGIAFEEFKRSFVFKIIILSPAILFFSLAGHRSVVFIILILLFYSSFGFLFKNKWHRVSVVTSIFVALAQPINFFTGAFRSYVSSESSFGFLDVIDRAYYLSEIQSVPLANSHMQITAAYVHLSNLSDVFFGQFHTVFSSLLNFLPRAVFPDKDYTTGYYMAYYFFPEWFSRGVHSSSITPGMFLDVLYNFGFLLGFLVFILVGYSLRVICVHLFSINNGWIFALYFTWAIAFNGFFDDLGGVVNKVVFGSIVFFIYLFCNFFRKNFRLGE